jgi:peptide/nickel transport system ATP-binding protein
MAAHSHHLWPDASFEGQVECWNDAARLADSIWGKVMGEVKMHPVDDFLQKFPHMLSGGQQQRIVIARAMLREPKLIVADEPVSMLDASVRVEVLKLMRALQESHGLSVIYITHDLSTVKYFSRRIFVMYAGNLIEKAETRRLLDNPLHPYTHALLAATSDPDARNADTFKEVPPGEPPSLVNPPSGCRFHPRCPHFMAGLCDVKVPPDFEPEPRHFVKCWLYEEPAALSAELSAIANATPVDAQTESVA